VNRLQTEDSVPPSGEPRSGEVWEQRFRAARVTLPDWAHDAPDRGVALSNASGTVEIYSFDAAVARADASPGAGLRQVTDRPQGTLHATITPDGQDIWWFADTDGDEFGVWNRQPWDASGEPQEAQPVSPALKPGFPAGLAIARDGTAYVGRSDDDGTEIWRVPVIGEATLIYANEEDASVGDVTDDGSLISISHSEHGDNRHPALRVVTPDGTAVADLWDGAGKGLDSLGFAPDRSVLLVGHERHGRAELLVWDVTGAEPVVTELAIDLTGELDASWFLEGDALLLERSERARSELFRVELTHVNAPAVNAIPTPPGVVMAATVRPGADVWFSWTSGATPPRVRDLADRVVVRAPGFAPPAGAPFRDVTVQTEAGPLHALLAVPPGPGPHPAVFDIHGGPNAHDEDAYDARSSAFVDAGYAAVLVNYRGSTGYGSTWRDANEADVGHTELADVAAVRAALVADGTLDPERTAVTGGSWGGYLSLLAAGTQPDLWAAVIAIVPVADYVAEYEDEMEPLRAFDRALLGGSPQEVPERYERASPLTYADAVKAPLLVMAGLNDPRCPIRQIENYLHRLDELATPYELYTYEAGHGALITEERIHQMKLELGHLARHLPTAARAV
jgi:dipeptidyl aminopeptidase/acylaminoacyl peptidase